eukprot:2751326-Rhodomonas_salina.3
MAGREPNTVSLRGPYAICLVLTWRRVLHVRVVLTQLHATSILVGTVLLYNSTRALVLRWSMCYQMCSEATSGRTCRWSLPSYGAPYPMSGTHIAYAATQRPVLTRRMLAPCPMSGYHRAYAATRCPVLTRRKLAPSAMFLTQRMVLHCPVSDTELASGTTGKSHGTASRARRREVATRNPPMLLRICHAASGTDESAVCRGDTGQGMLLQY